MGSRVKERGVFLLGQGRESGEDPYYQHLYRVNLDGSGGTLLNPGDFDHRVKMGESKRFFVKALSGQTTPLRHCSVPQAKRSPISRPQTSVHSRSPGMSSRTVQGRSRDGERI
ncbi:MAG: hypothetical protein CM1200mP14_17480 [Gammaproteobacteria bacterium]|nr:MAG: hypothetical protein CM1200mP14_17480 [Gammaproteobacteria bacterium]